MTDNIFKEINKLLKSKDLDIRKSNYSRFMDQKCTPDVISFIADCIVNISSEYFCFNDIYKSRYFIENIQKIFNKPSPENKNTGNEYDKIINQPLRMLNYAGVISSEKKGLSYIYKIENKEIINFIALRDKNAYEFLICYIKKVLNDSALTEIFENFYNNPEKESFSLLKKKFDLFITGHTKIRKEKEIHRIFTKILNPLSVNYTTKGTKGGNLSKFNITYSDLMYNKINFRDINKNKNISRKEALKSYELSENYSDYLIEKGKKIVKKLHLHSEVNDRLTGNTTNVHHIFPKSDFPQIAAYTENLIALTAGQHLQFAHPDGNTGKIDIMYQYTCLKSKLKSIKDSNSIFYRKENFIYVLNTGFKYDTTNQIPFNASFEELEIQIEKFYKNI